MHVRTQHYPEHIRKHLFSTILPLQLASSSLLPEASGARRDEPSSDHIIAQHPVFRLLRQSERHRRSAHDRVQQWADAAVGACAALVRGGRQLRVADRAELKVGSGYDVIFIYYSFVKCFNIFLDTVQ